ncbi:MAG TPA: peptidase M14, partial [Ignavibacteriales bacterium]|nr:peptidase M14 [Ignavibacteriales bacterium]
MIKKIFFIITIGLEITMAQNIDLAQNLYSNYEIYRETKLTHRRFKHADILSLINEVKRQGIFSVEKAGQSVEGRDIYLLSIGRGKSKVFLWSQMHGDEPTATMALFDVFNF